MTFTSLKPLLAGATVATLLAFAAACSSTSPSMNPTAPTTAANSAAAGANFSPNPDPCDPADLTCVCAADPTLPECQPPTGTPCSPGYWKNHEAAFASSCQDAWELVEDDVFDSCISLMTALTCRGSDASCHRHEAAGLLNTVSGCTESD